MSEHRLNGLEPDNLLAFLALLGLLRALEAARPDLKPRTCWDIDNLPVRPVLYVKQALTETEVAEAAAEGIALLAEHHNFDRADLNHTRQEARILLAAAQKGASPTDRYAADLLSCLMNDAAIKIEDKNETIEPTPLCLQSGSGHQHFLQRLKDVPLTQYAAKDKKGKKKPIRNGTECLSKAIFSGWLRDDELASSFRWEPEDGVRYALMAGDPTDSNYKGGTQLGANRLAAIGISLLPINPRTTHSDAPLQILGGKWRNNSFSFLWPIWSVPTTLRSILSLLGHPYLTIEDNLSFLDVDHVREAKRIFITDYTKNFTRGRTMSEARD